MRAKISSATACWRSRDGASSRSKTIGSPYWMVTLANRPRFLAQPAGPRSPRLRVHGHARPAAEDRAGGDEGLLVAVPAANREHAAVAVDPLHRRLEELRLGHEADLAADERAQEEVVEEREVVGGKDDRARAGHVLGRDRAGPVEAERDRRGQTADDLVDGVGLVRAGVLVEPREVLGGPLVLVDLRLHRGELFGHVGRLPRSARPVTAHRRTGRTRRGRAAAGARTSSGLSRPRRRLPSGPRPPMPRGRGAGSGRPGPCGSGRPERLLASQEETLRGGSGRSDTACRTRYGRPGPRRTDRRSEPSAPGSYRRSR